MSYSIDPYTYSGLFLILNKQNGGTELDHFISNITYGKAYRTSNLSTHFIGPQQLIWYPKMSGDGGDSGRGVCVGVHQRTFHNNFHSLFLFKL